MRRFWVPVVSVFLISGLLVASPVATVPAQAASISKLTVAPDEPIKGEQFVVSGQLSTKVVRPVQLQRKSGSKWKAVASAKTDASGRFSITTKTKAASVQLRVVAKKVKVNKRTLAKVTAKKVTVKTVGQYGRVAMPSQGYVNETLTATIGFTPARSGRPVQLQYLVGDEWQQVAQGVQGADGTVALQFTPSLPGTYSYRAVALAWHGAAQMATPGLDVAITIDTSGRSDYPGSGGPLTISSSICPTQTSVGSLYVCTLTANGGEWPMEWQAIGLPAGLSMFYAGTITGMPSKAGSYQMTLTVTDAKGATASQVISLLVEKA